MARTIEIDDEVYEALKARAEPFVDTPNSVLRRLLGLQPAARPRRERVRGQGGGRRGGRAAGPILEDSAYVRPLLEAIERRGGAAPAAEVVEEVGKVLADRLTEDDRRPLSSGTVRWKNRVYFTRLRLVRQGLLSPDAPRGVWRITEEGRRFLAGQAVGEGSGA